MDCFLFIFLAWNPFLAAAFFGFLLGFFTLPVTKGRGALVGSLEVDTPLHDVS